MKAGIRMIIMYISFDYEFIYKSFYSTIKNQGILMLLNGNEVGSESLYNLVLRIEPETWLGILLQRTGRSISQNFNFNSRGENAPSNTYQMNENSVQ